MQTFLPYPSFTKSAQVLDNKRLGKQRVECKQILKALLGEYDDTGAWVNHPAIKMWRGHETLLGIYAITICTEWRKRGYNDSLLPYFFEQVHPHFTRQTHPAPPWLGDGAFHASHRSNLLRKDPSHYSQFGWEEPDDLPYIWPVN